MSAMSDYLENKLIDHLFRDTTFAKPAALYIALFTAPPSDAGGGTEVTGGSYARVAVAPSLTNWNATQGGTAGVSSGTGGTTSNAVAINFPTPTVAWGTVTHVGIFDAATVGNLMWLGALNSPQVVSSGVAYSLPAGSLTIQVDN